MIGHDFDREGRTFELGAPFFKRADYGHEFFIVNLIITLGWIVLLGEVRHGT